MPAIVRVAMQAFGFKIKERLKKLLRFDDPPVAVGMGVVSPLGVGHETFWENLLAGKTGMGRTTLFDSSGVPNKISAQVWDWESQRDLHIPPKKQKFLSRSAQFALTAANLAFADARLPALDPGRTDVIFGGGTGAVEEIEAQIRVTGLTYSNKIDPFTALKYLIFAPACVIALEHGIKGLVTVVSSACASAPNALGIAAGRLLSGEADVVLSGGVDAPINLFTIAGLSRSNFLTTSTDPKDALCPYDKRRTSSAMGEGSAAFVLMRRSRAEKIGARIYGEIIGYNQSNENVNLLFMRDPTGQAWAENMKKAINGHRVDVVNGHGPSHKNIDADEVRALKLALGKRAHEIPVNSIKGSIGSGMAAAGALQIASAFLTLHRGIIPGTYNYLQPDDDCDLNIVSKPTPTDARVLLLNAHAMGGANSSLLLGKYIS